MKWIYNVLMMMGGCCMGLSLTAQTLFDNYKPHFTLPRNYVCYQTTDSLKLDGKLDEKAWQQAKWSEEFVNIEGDVKPRPAHTTRVKMLWNQQYLFIAAELEEPHVWAKLQQHDTIIYQDNDFEVFLDPEGDTHNYFEIEINARNTVMDLFMPKPYRDGGKALLTWDTKGLRTAVHVTGTLNNPKDKDQKWTVEMAIPFSAVRFYNGPAIPQNNSLWRINFSRVQWDTDIKNGEYIKRRDANDRTLPEHNWVWSPQGTINMHTPERWGYLQFSTQSPGGTPVAFQLPEAEIAKKYLWLIYYKQREYRQQNKRYATTLADINIPATITAENGKAYTLQLESMSTQFKATVTGHTLNSAWHINQEGKIFSGK
jgi:hypothetical protein